MDTVFDILNNLDWNNSSDEQNKAINKAEMTSKIWHFIQPCNDKYNKNVWENCAKILQKRSDKELSPYFVPLLEWLQDANWPGFDIIFCRLKIVDAKILVGPFSYCLMRAIERDDIQWLNYLSGLIVNKKLFLLLDNDFQLITKQHYKNYWENID